MPILALNSAASGLSALSTRIDVTANNLANSETNGFKRSRVNFEDLGYMTLRQPGALNSTGENSPAGIQVGLGTRVSNTQIDLTQGSPEQTNNPTDVAIIGEGFFKVQINPQIGGGTAYTRSGNLFINKEGDLVLGTGDGYRLDPSINVGEVSSDRVTISMEGTVQVTQADGTSAEVGTLQLSTFRNPQGLKALGGSLFLETEASGAAVERTPGDEGAGQIQQGFLETSNVDPVKELVGLIKTQRSFELNSQSIQTADQALQTITNLRRF